MQVQRGRSGKRVEGHISFRWGTDEGRLVVHSYQYPNNNRRALLLSTVHLNVKEARELVEGFILNARLKEE